MELFMFLPRLFLSKPSRGGLIPKGRLKERVTKFCAGEWIPLLEASMEDALVGRSAQAKKGSESSWVGAVGRALKCTSSVGGCSGDEERRGSPL